MAAFLLTVLLSTQAVPALPRPDRPFRRRPTIATIEGPTGASQIGLFDLATGEFTPERLDRSLSGWTQLTPMEIDFSGRVELNNGLASSPRLRRDVGASAARIELPTSGSLYMIRGAVEGQLQFALIHVRPDGSPVNVLSVAALPGGSSPFQPKIGIAPGGRGALVATREAAGGDLYEVDLATDEVHLRTSAEPPLAFGVDGIWLGDSWGFGISRAGPWRFLRRPGAQVELIPANGPAPSTWRGDAAMNLACHSAVAIAGAGAGQWRPFVFTSNGSAIPAASIPAAISPAGFAPESTFGPFLGLCDDGVTAAWRVEGGSAPNTFRDVFLGRAAAAPLEVSASGDALIVDTANEIGRVLSMPSGDFLFAVGEDNDPSEGGLEGADFLRARLDPTGQVSLTNVSRTSPDATLPLFNQGVPSWTPTFATLVAPGEMIVHDDDEKALYSLSIGTNSRTLVLDEVREVLWLEAAGAPGRPGSWIACIQRDDDLRRFQIVGAATSSASASVIDPGSPTAEFRWPAAWRGPQHTVGYIRHDFGLSYLDVVPVSALSRTRWSHSPSGFIPPIEFISARRVMFTEGALGTQVQQTLWSFRGSAPDLVLNAPPRPSRILR